VSHTTAATAAEQLDKLYEFDREPVSDDRLLGPGYFAGAYSGEHIAATEFVIGVTFVNWGASVSDIFLGLAIGNILAVLTWTLLCAPIAVETRLTMYWYLRRIGGPVLTVIYNVLNALLFASSPDV
jgi:NCS1 family nucleobase:cation symporter-1